MTRALVLLATRFARDIQQDASSPPTEFRQCSLARMGSLGPAALYNYPCYPFITRRAAFPISIRVYGNLRYRLYRERGRHAQLQAAGRQGVSYVVDSERAYTEVLPSSFLQSLCVLGYCLFPLDVAALLATFIRILWIRIPIALVGFAWSTYGKCTATRRLQKLTIIPAAINFLGGTRLEDNRAFLAVYPAILLFFLLAWITMLS